MYIEDILTMLVIKAKLNPYDSTMLHSFYDQISKGSGFTEKQSFVILKVLKKQIVKLNLLAGKDLTPYLDNPQFKIPIRTLNNVKRISIVPHAEFNKVIKLEFPYNEKLVNSLRQEKLKLNFVIWNPEEKAWLFSLDESSIQFIAPLIASDNFQADEEFKEYANQLTEITANLEKYVPMVTFENGVPAYSNAPNRVAPLTTPNLIEALFEARKVGITTWDDAANEELDRTSNTVVRDFLKSDFDASFGLDLEKHSLHSLRDVVKCLYPCIVVIPGGTELDKLKSSIDFLKDTGISESEISVMFRLPKDTGDAFNKFVKDEKLNSPITELTKAVFVSGKIPKVVIESKKHFNCVLNFNFYNIHHTVREYIKWHQNVIHVQGKIQQRTIEFGNL
jgi:hypothetical protein